MAAIDMQAPELARILGEYSGIDNIEARLKNMVAASQKPQFIIPVLGIQGAGKSSFLNALLFKDIILPVEVSETTCIPTEVMYADIPTPEATVYFADQPEQKVACTEDELKAFVHQEFNPANYKKVVKVVIHLCNDLLKTGLVIVDLPGVGSGTAENQQQTMNYLKLSSGGIFIMSESLKTPDALFISTALPMLNNVFFIQNRWAGETSAETQEAAEYNHEILKNKVEELHIPDTMVPDFDIISVKKALDAVIMNDSSALANSGMVAFKQKLVNFATSWKVRQGKAQTEQLRNLAVTCIRKINQQTSTFQNDPVPEQQRLAERRQMADAEIAEKQVLIRRASDIIVQQKVQLYKKLNDMVSIARGELRTAIRNLIDSEAISGEHLGSAYNDHVSQQNTLIYQEMFTDLTVLTGNVREQLEGLDTGKEFEQQNINSENYFSSKSNLHSLYQPVISSAAGIAAAWGGAAAAGALLGSSAGPIGTVIGGIVGGLIGYFSGSYVGQKAREIHVRSQQAEAMRELFKAVQGFCETTTNVYKTGIDNYLNVLNDTISSWFNARKTAVIKEINDLQKSLALSECEKAKRIEVLAKDLAYLQNLLTTLGA